MWFNVPLGWETCGGFGELGVPREDLEALSFQTLPCGSFPYGYSWGVSFYNTFNTLVNVSKHSSDFYEPF